MGDLFKRFIAAFYGYDDGVRGTLVFYKTIDRIIPLARDQ